MAETGPTKMAPSNQGALREEDDVWAGHPQAWKVGRDDENIQPGERVCSQDRVCCGEANGDQRQKGLLAGTLEAHWSKDPMGNDLLDGGRSVLEAAGVVHVATNPNTPEVSIRR